MGQPKGSTGNPLGRPAGTPNRATTLAREAIARFVDDNSERLQSWLDEIATDDPQAAFDCFMKVVEYHVPKLQRTEHTGEDGGPMQHQHLIKPEDRDIIARYTEQIMKEKT